MRWCERGDSNPHGFTRQILSLVRLPIPPLSQNSTAPSGLWESFRPNRPAYRRSAQCPAFARHSTTAPAVALNLLYFVQLLVDQQRQKRQQRNSGQDAEHAQRNGELVHLDHQLRLLIPHVGICLVEKELIVLVHGERALVDQQEYQSHCTYSEQRPHDFNRCHTPPQQVPTTAIPLRGGEAVSRTSPGEGFSARL